MSSATMGDRLRAARKARGITQEELARRANVSTFTVSKYEQGLLDNPTKDAMVAIAHELGISLDWLVLGKGRGPRIVKGAA